MADWPQTFEVVDDEMDAGNYNCIVSGRVTDSSRVDIFEEMQLPKPSAAMDADAKTLYKQVRFEELSADGEDSDVQPRSKARISVAERKRMKSKATDAKRREAPMHEAKLQSALRANDSFYRLPTG